MILDTEIINTSKRLILEMYHISKINNTIDKKSDTQQLSNIYTYTLSQEMTKNKLIISYISVIYAFPFKTFFIKNH